MKNLSRLNQEMLDLGRMLKHAQERLEQATSSEEAEDAQTEIDLLKAEIDETNPFRVITNQAA